jgi:hypothetical protein
MGLVTCPDCSHDVSDLASACPNCGRPMAGPSRPTAVDKCQVVLKTASGIGFKFHWVLEAQLMAPTGMVVIASCPYSSDNYLANFQASKPEFLRARDQITNELLRDGWELVDSSSDSLSLPRFERPAGLAESAGTGITPNGVARNSGHAPVDEVTKKEKDLQSRQTALRAGYVLSALLGLALIPISGWPGWGILAPAGIVMAAYSLGIILLTRWFSDYAGKSSSLKAMYWIGLVPCLLGLIWPLFVIVIIWLILSALDS